MDPQKLSQLDPKLRDAYQRVMGTVIPEPQANPTPTSTPTTTPDPVSTPTPTPQPQPEVTPTTPAAQPEPFFIPQPETNPASQSTPTQAPTPTQPPAQSSNFVQMNSEVAASPTAAPASNFTAPASSAQTMPMKKKSGMMVPVLFAIVGLIFIVIYTIFWTRIFNFKLPFLP